MALPPTRRNEDRPPERPGRSPSAHGGDLVLHVVGLVGGSAGGAVVGLFAFWVLTSDTHGRGATTPWDNTALVLTAIAIGTAIGGFLGVRWIRRTLRKYYE